MTTTYQYDRLDRLIKVTWPDDRWKKIQRDGRGQIERTKYGFGLGGLTSTYKYDGAGNLVERTTEACPEHGPKTEYEYDIYNRRLVETRGEVIP